MSDFYLDFRKVNDRSMASAVRFLQYYPDIKIFKIEESEFSLLLTRSDDETLWAPYQSIDHKLIVALAGRIAMEEKEWNDAKMIPGDGGIACKAIYNMYNKSGLPGLHCLNGSFVVMVYDVVLKKMFIVSDRYGMFPFFTYDVKNGAPVFS